MTTSPKKKTISPSRMYEIIRRPLVSEKTTSLTEKNQHGFEVSLDATKPEIRAAIEGLFKVKVLAVNTLRVKGKTKRFRGIEGKRSEFKKAYVTLDSGSTLDVMAGI